MKNYLIFVSLCFFNFSFCQQLANSNLDFWANISYGQEPINWQYNDGTGLVYGTNNVIRSFDGVDPLTTIRVTGGGAFGGSGSSVLLETKASQGSTMISNGYTTIPGYLYREDPITDPNIGSLTFNYKSAVVQGDSCYVKVGLIDANFNIYSLGVFWIKPSDNSVPWKTKTIMLENLLPGIPSEIFIEAMSTSDENYSYATPIIGSQLYLDNFVLNYCNNPIITNVSETICDYMLPYTWNGLIFNNAGNQPVTLTSFLGCDSIVNMTLNVIPGPYTLIPDVGFEEYLGSMGLDPCGIDGRVPTSLIDTVVSLTIIGNGQTPSISDLTGIEDFTSLETLNITRQSSQTTTGVYFNAASGLNLSQNTNLKNFVCTGCNLQNLNLSANLNLQTLDIGLWAGQPSLPLNNMQTLNLTSNLNLQYLDCSYSGLQNLTLPNTSSLTILNCSRNSLNTIDLSTVPNLQSLNASNNVLIGLGTNSNSSISQMNLSKNYFTGLNLSGFTQLISLDCSENFLSCLDISNGINTQFNSFNSSGNFNLTCIEVDDSTFSTNNPIWNSGIDTWSSFSVNCPSICVTADLSEIENIGISLFPNPTSEELNISVSNLLIGENFNILDLMGKLYFRGILTDTDTSLDLGNLIPGIYFISIPSSGIVLNFVKL